MPNKTANRGLSSGTLSGGREREETRELTGDARATPGKKWF